MTTGNDFDVREAIAALSSSLTVGHPQLPSLLRKIHTTLKADPDVVTILSDEERATVIAGLEIQTRTKLAEVTTPKKSKSLKNMTLDDI